MDRTRQDCSSILLGWKTLRRLRIGKERKLDIQTWNVNEASIIARASKVLYNNIWHAFLAFTHWLYFPWYLVGLGLSGSSSRVSCGFICPVCRRESLLLLTWIQYCCHRRKFNIRMSFLLTRLVIRYPSLLLSTSFSCLLIPSVPERLHARVDVQASTMEGITLRRAAAL